MREQTDRVRTGYGAKLIILSVTALLLIAAAYAAVTFFSRQGYSHPEFDATAAAGVPAPADNMAYNEISAENGVRFSLAATMYQQEDGSLLVYFTNPAASQCVLMCEIKNEAGKTLYKSGAVRPGEYVERLTPLTEIENIATPITMWVYAFEPDTWYSVGEVQLSNILQPY